MKIENLKALEQLLKLCQKQGVEAMEVDGLKFNLRPLQKVTKAKDFVSEMFPEANVDVPKYNPPAVTADQIKTDALSEEDLLFYSAKQEMTGSDQ